MGRWVKTSLPIFIFKEHTMSTSPLNHSPVIGGKVETQFEDDGVTPIPFSTLANQASEDNHGNNPDFRPSTGRSREEENAIGKGANPSADVVTKNHTTIDPVHGEPSPAVDGETIVESVPAVLPAGSLITEADGEVHEAGETPKSERRAKRGKVVEQTEPVPAVMKKTVEETQAEERAAKERYDAAAAQVERKADKA
jgi:hypothetical protein